MSKLREAARRALTALNTFHGAVTDTDWKMDFQPEIDALRDALAEPAKGEAKIRIPTATMEQEFSNYHRLGYKAGATAERAACAEICDRIARRYGECPDVEPWAQGFKEGASVSAAKIRARGQK